MIDALHAAFLARAVAVAPDLARSDFGSAVGFWVERLQRADTEFRPDGWELASGFEGHIVGEVVEEFFGPHDAALIASLTDNRLRLELPANAEKNAVRWAGGCELISRETGVTATANVLIAQLRFRFTGGVYRRLQDYPPVAELMVQGPADQEYRNALQ